ncbi:hypothetical protein [Yoonia sp. I 8.24]|uniref:hypothetical protein n=1 Tax=Yoonia sp. I 8.24 TaxID=1537229 RepID=UPI001EDCE3D7|nr:hypothetical protein [Yoonia sp. I 8.24]MCG3268221.1 hypothetical protein [Yoonia sp. I 8.24]
MKLGWKNRLRKVVLEMKNGSRPESLTVPALREIVNAPSFEELSKYAAQLISNGEIEIHYRVKSPDTKVTIAEFGHLYQIPTRVFDDSSDSYVTVNPVRDVEVIYSVGKA